MAKIWARSIPHPYYNFPNGTTGAQLPGGDVSPNYNYTVLYVDPARESAAAHHQQRDSSDVLFSKRVRELLSGGFNTVTSLEEKASMRTIELNAANWKTLSDFYNALLAALGAPENHGHNANALLDLMIWTDRINAAKPPYSVRITGTADLPNEVKAEITLVERAIKIARAEYRKWRGRDVEVALEFDVDQAG